LTSYPSGLSNEENHNFKGDYLAMTEASFFLTAHRQVTGFDIILLNNSYQTADPETGASAFRRSRVPVFSRSLFSFPLDSMIFSGYFLNATSVAASLGRSGR
jgi:hypothetical protein